VPEDLRDLRVRRTVADHPGGQTVPEQARHSATSGTYVGASEGQPDTVINRARARQSDAWRDQAEKDPPGATAPAVLTEIARDGVTDIGEERQMIQPRPARAPPLRAT
jgi:hypothetical protein